MESTAKFPSVLSCAIQTEPDIAYSHNKTGIYEKVEDTTRYKLIQMVSLYKH